MGASGKGGGEKLLAAKWEAGTDGSFNSIDATRCRQINTLLYNGGRLTGRAPKRPPLLPPRALNRNMFCALAHVHRTNESGTRT